MNGYEYKESQRPPAEAVERASERVSVEYYGIHMWDYEYKINQHMQKEKAKMETYLILDKM